MTACPEKWLVLHHAVEHARALGKRLLDQYKDIDRLLALDEQGLSGLTASIRQLLLSPDQRRIDSELAWLAQQGHGLITYHDDDYPVLLKEIADPPVLLFFIGQRAAIKGVSFAMVGSRNPTEHGKRMASDFAMHLADLGLTISSGLALGIDYASHVGALQAGGQTIAVLGNGLDTIYPARHAAFAKRMIEQGLLLSEFSPFARPLPHHFPIRNRIISGMSTGVLVVEAALKSGSLITAQHALDQGREVFAIPGSINNPVAKGCHALIKQGAKLVEDVQDIVGELAPLLHASRATVPMSGDRACDEPIALGEDLQSLIEKIGFAGVTIDQLVEGTGLTAEVISSMLLTLELNGLIEIQHDNYYVRIK